MYEKQNKLDSKVVIVKITIYFFLSYIYIFLPGYFHDLHIIHKSLGKPTDLGSMWFPPKVAFKADHKTQLHNTGNMWASACKDQSGLFLSRVV